MFNLTWCFTQTQVYIDDLALGHHWKYRAFYSRNSTEGTMRALLFTALFCLTFLVACQGSSKSPVSQNRQTDLSSPPQKTPSKKAQSPYVSVLADVARIRDRPWKQKVTLEAVDVAQLSQVAVSTHDVERQRIASMLFGQKTALTSSTWSTHVVAQSDDARHVVRYAACLLYTSPSPRD